MVIKNRSDGMSERFSVFAIGSVWWVSTNTNTSYQKTKSKVNTFKLFYLTFSLLHKKYIVNFVQKVY